MKKNKDIIIALLLIFALMFGFKYLNQERSLEINRLDINATILANGDMRVEETFKYRFNGEYNGIYRSYYLNGCDGYLIDKVTIIDKHGNEIIATEGYNQEDNTYELNETNTYLKLYSKSKNECKTIKIEYTVLGAAKKYKDCAAIYWNFYDVSDMDYVKAGTLNISLDGAEFNQENFFYKMYGDGKIKGKNNEDSVNIRFKKLTSLIGVQVRFQKDFLNNDVTESSTTFEQSYSYRLNKMSEHISTWEYILFSILPLIFILGIYGLILLYKYIDNLIFEKKLKKYRAKLKQEDISSNEYISTEPTPDIPPAFINFMYNDCSAEQNILIDSLLYLVNKGVYKLDSINNNSNWNNNYKKNISSNNLIFTYTGELKNIKDKHLLHLVKWLNTYDKGNGIQIYKIHQALCNESYAIEYVSQKREFQKIIIKDAIKNGYIVKIKRRYIISNEFYNQWEKWKCYREFIVNQKIDLSNTEIRPDNIQPIIIYGVALGLTSKELNNITTCIMDVMTNAKEFESFMRDMYLASYSIANLSKTFKDLDKKAFEKAATSATSSDSNESGSVSSGSDFTGGGGGTSGGF